MEKNWEKIQSVSVVTHMANILEEGITDFFFSVLWVGFFVHVIDGYQQIREAQEYKEKFVVSENTFEFMGTCELAV